MGEKNDPERSKNPGHEKRKDEQETGQSVGADQGLDDVRDRLNALEHKLDGHRPDPRSETIARRERTNFGMAVRVSSDFIAAIFVGAALGWFLDSFAGTSPFGLIILLLLGFAAGVLNVMRTLGLVANAPSAQARNADGTQARNADGTQARRHDTEEKDREGR